MKAWEKQCKSNKSPLWSIRKIGQAANVVWLERGGSRSPARRSSLFPYVLSSARQSLICGLQRGSQRQSRGRSLAESGPEHHWQSSLLGRTWRLRLSYESEDRQTPSERDMLQFSHYRLGPHNSELKDSREVILPTPHSLVDRGSLHSIPTQKITRHHLTTRHGKLRTSETQRQKARSMYWLYT